MYYENELYHHGVKGQKWGVRRYQNADGTLNNRGIKRAESQVKKVNTMYDRSNMWTNRKIVTLDAKGKTAKANVMREMVKLNEKNRKIHTNQIKNASAQEYKQNHKTAVRDWVFGGQDNMASKYVSMNSVLTRFNEYQLQRATRWMSNFTANNTLARMTPEDGLQYLRTKAVSARSYNGGYSDGHK